MENVHQNNLGMTKPIFIIYFAKVNNFKKKKI